MLYADVNPDATVVAGTSSGGFAITTLLSGVVVVGYRIVFNNPIDSFSVTPRAIGNQDNIVIPFVYKESQSVVKITLWSIPDMRKVNDWGFYFMAIDDQNRGERSAPK